MSTTSHLIDHYRHWLGFESFYSIQLNQIGKRPGEFIQNERYLRGLSPDPEAKRTQLIQAGPGNLRIDELVWFGSLDTAQERIVVFGCEPRDTDAR